jgi:hypothetical protein
MKNLITSMCFGLILMGPLQAMDVLEEGAAAAPQTAVGPQSEDQIALQQQIADVEVYICTELNDQPDLREYYLEQLDFLIASTDTLALPEAIDAFFDEIMDSQGNSVTNEGEEGSDADSAVPPSREELLSQLDDIGNLLEMAYPDEDEAHANASSHFAWLSDLLDTVSAIQLQALLDDFEQDLNKKIRGETRPTEDAFSDEDFADMQEQLEFHPRHKRHNPHRRTMEKQLGAAHRKFRQLNKEYNKRFGHKS